MKAQTKWNGGQVGDYAYCVLAHNESPLTYIGTNTWVIGAPDAPGCVVVESRPR